MESSSPTP
ncbi:hypothetical protein LINPERPRIM_LOCUS40668 [Linum perenne]